ncbi:hypothetical protein scyTo_0004364, partial [Scyliorhinus torazame]|nr:hypothetical protein [Scyliorhinus torazame]
VLEIDGSNAGDLDSEFSKKAKETLKCELTRAEFADALGLKEDSMFVEQMFSLADQDGNGYLSFREFLDIFVVLMKGSPEAKSKLMFTMYDVDGNGSMSKDEFSQLLRRESMSMGAFIKLQPGRFATDRSFIVPGIEGQKRGTATRVSCIIRKKAEVPKSGANQVEPSPQETSPQETSGLDLRKRFGKKSSQGVSKVFAEAKRDKYTKNKFQQKYNECRQYIQNHQRQIFCSIIFFGITVGVFVERAYFYAELREHSGVPQTTRVGLIIARGSAAAVSFLYSYILLTMCRNLITVLRETFLNNFIPFDSAVDFHRWIAMAAACFSGVTHLEFKRPQDFTYKSGQWVRIANLLLGTNEYHPFTLTSAPHEDTLSLHIRAVGPWTTRLREIYSQENISALGKYPKIYLDGPFGEGHQEWNKFEVSILVGGGIGVTPFASILKDLVFKSTTNSRILCKRVNLL